MSLKIIASLELIDYSVRACNLCASLFVDYVVAMYASIKSLHCCLLYPCSKASFLGTWRTYQTLLIQWQRPERLASCRLRHNVDWICPWGWGHCVDEYFADVFGMIWKHINKISDQLLNEPFYRKLQNFYHSELRLWDYPYNATIAEAAGLTDAERRLWLGPTARALESTHAEIHGVLFRTELAERNRATQHSGIVATFTDRHRSSFKYGKLRNIYSVNIGGQQHLILRVNFFKSVKQDRRQDRRWVSNTGRSIFLPPTPTRFIHFW